MSRGKHAPNRLDTYLRVHTTNMEQLLRGDFVVEEHLVIEGDGAGGFIMSGRIHCESGIYLDVNKHLVRLSGDGNNAIVQTVEYSYNAAVAGLGNIFRYDSPHHDHNQEHHVHRFDVLNGDMEGIVENEHSEQGRPTLREVLRELEDWFNTNRAALFRP